MDDRAAIGKRGAREPNNRPHANESEGGPAPNELCRSPFKCLVVGLWAWWTPGLVRFGPLFCATPSSGDLFARLTDAARATPPIGIGQQSASLTPSRLMAAVSQIICSIGASCFDKQPRAQTLTPTTTDDREIKTRVA